MSHPPYQVLLVDDHPFIREGMSKVITKNEDFAVCAEAGSVPEAIAALQRHQPDFAIVDMFLEDGTGMEVLDYIQKECPSCIALVVSMYEDPVYIEQSIEVGAKGYIFKRESVQTVLQALQEARSGGIYLSPRVVKVLMEAHTQEQSPQDVQTPLSARELEVYKLLGEGLRRNQIAESLIISPHTVDSHIERIKLKLNCESTSHLIRLAIQSRLKG